MVARGKDETKKEIACHCAQLPAGHRDRRRKQDKREKTGGGGQERGAWGKTEEEAVRGRATQWGMKH